MFAIGLSEPLEIGGLALERQSIVWIGGPCGESSRGIPEEHPICGVVCQIERRFGFCGSWIVCHRHGHSTMKQVQRLRLRLLGSGWVLDSEESGEFLLAHKPVSSEEPWPYPGSPGLPYRPAELLLVGAIGHAAIACGEVPVAPRSVPGETLVLTEPVAHYLAARSCYVVCFGWTHTENTPGLTIIGPPGIDPRQFVPAGAVHSVHRGADAEWAWSQATVR